MKFNPEEYSLEQRENLIRARFMIAEDITREYVPVIREAVKDIESLYIPTANRELFEASVIFHSILNKCRLEYEDELSKYIIKTTDGGRYYAYVDIPSQCSDPDYVPEFKDLPSYSACGCMNRRSAKYPNLFAWSVDSRYSSREGRWKNNLTSDYEYLYEFIKGDISDTPANSEKIERLRERGFISEDGSVNIMIFKGKREELFDRIPALTKV